MTISSLITHTVEETDRQISRERQTDRSAERDRQIDRETVR